MYKCICIITFAQYSYIVLYCICCNRNSNYNNMYNNVYSCLDKCFILSTVINNLES